MEFLTPPEKSALIYEPSEIIQRFMTMDDLNAVKQRVKQLMVENLMLQVTADEIRDDQPLFGPNSLGLDSVDALQLVVALDKNFGLKIADPASAKQILQNVNTIAAAVATKR